METKPKTHVNRFSPAQIDELKTSPYVEAVSECEVRFTATFKKHFYGQYQAGKRPAEIFAECGISPEILGRTRINSFRYNLCLKARKGKGFSGGKGRNCFVSTSGADETVEKKLKSLESELAYTRKEVEFLKKIRMADLEAQKQWESKHPRK